MRAILIDPFTRTVEAVENDGNLHSIYAAIKCDLVDIVRVWGGEAMFIDDEGLMVPKEVQQYFQISGYAQPFAGRAIIFGVDHCHENADTFLDVEYVRVRVGFLDREDVDPEQYLGFTFSVIGS